MRLIRSIVPLLVFAPVVAGCQSGDVTLQPQNSNLLVSPSSMVFSASAPQSTSFSVADKATTGGTISVDEGTCNGIATFNAPSSPMTIGRNPGVGSSSGSYAVQPLAAGSCTLRITDTSGNLATIFVTVGK